MAAPPTDTPSDVSWALVAPVFSHRERRDGLWLELRCSDDEADHLAPLLEDRLQACTPESLFVFEHGTALSSRLPLTLDCDQILVAPAIAACEPSPLPDGVLQGWYGSTADLSEKTEAAWQVVTDAAGPVGPIPSLADGLSGWQQCQTLADLGWEAFMMTGNQAAGSKRPRSEQIVLTRLLGLIARDADTDELEDLFKTQPKLAYDLLNLVNSPALNLRTPATNFRHAITLLGRRQLQRWLQLLIFTRQTSKGEVNILLWHSAFRGRLMELLAKHLDWPAEQVDQAFMVGVFSLIHVLLEDSLENLLGPLGLSDAVLAALLQRHGPLGQLLEFAAAVESRDTAIVSNLSQHFGLNAPTLLEIQLDGLFWVESFSSQSC